MVNEFDFTSYQHLVAFLGGCLGEHSEVILYSFEDLDHSVIAIHNGHISGRELGDPVTSFALSKLKDKGKEGPPYYLSYPSLSKNNTPLRSNSFFILDKLGSPKGLLCINTDVSKYQQAAELLQQLAFMPTLSVEKQSSEEVERFQSSPKDVIMAIIDDVTQTVGVNPDRLTANEKIEIVRRLNEEGFFLIKGAVSQIAGILGSSEATVYRYLSTVNKQRSEEF
jgi:predicted transcriptional regulator YheO